MLTLENAYVKSVKADMLKGQVTLSFVLTLDDQALKARRVLTIMALDGTPLKLSIDPKPEQMSLLPDENTTTTIESSLRPGEVLDFDKVYNAVMHDETR